MSTIECANELKEFGYNPHLIINTHRNNYFPSHVKLDCVFDFSDFENEVIYNPILDNDGSPIIDGLKLKRVTQNQTSYLIYVDEYHEGLNNYQSYIFGHTELNISDRRPLCNTDIVNSEIKQMAKDFLGDVDNLVTLHYRATDGLGNTENYVNTNLHRFDEFVENNKEHKILICSNGKLVRDYLVNKYENVITFNFSNNDIELFPCYTFYRGSSHSDEVLIKHSQEIMAEMVMIKYSKKILSISPFLSNFVSYGIMNNVYNIGRSDFFRHESC